MNFMGQSLLEQLQHLEQLFPKVQDSGDLPALERLLEEVDRIVGCRECHRIYRSIPWDPANESLLDRLQSRVIAAFSELEKAYARKSDHQVSSTEFYLRRVSRFAEKESRRAGITRKSRVLFVGCGALPVSSVALAVATGCRVVAIDTDRESTAFASAMIERLGLSPQIRVVCADGAKLKANLYSHVALASLVPNKREVLDNLAHTLPTGSRVLLRYGNGLYRLINYELYETPILPWRVLERIHEPGHIHETLLLCKGSSSREIW